MNNEEIYYVNCIHEEEFSRVEESTGENIIGEVVTAMIRKSICKKCGILYTKFVK